MSKRQEPAAPCRFACALVPLIANVPTEDIKARIVAELTQLIAFDMLLWASGERSHLTIHDAYQYNLPDELLSSWDRIKHQDRLLAHLLANHGSAFDMFEFYEREERGKLAVYRQHSRVFGIENAISIALVEEATGLLEVLSLYRRDPAARFSEADRRNLEFAFPLMRAVRRENQIHAVTYTAEANRRDLNLAFCDKQGWLRQASEGFVSRLQETWPAWKGPKLPKPLLSWIKDAEAHPRRENGLYFTKRANGDHILLTCERNEALHSLTLRERTIAEHFAAGKTYRTIAEALSLSPSTIRRHLESVYRKTGVSSKIELLRLLDQ